MSCSAVEEDRMIDLFIFFSCFPRWNLFSRILLCCKVSRLWDLISDYWRQFVRKMKKKIIYGSLRVRYRRRRRPERGRPRTSAIPAKSGWRRRWLRGNRNCWCGRPGSVGRRGCAVETCMHYARSANERMLRRSGALAVVVNRHTGPHELWLRYLHARSI